jgi:hypothetical protein
MVTGRHERRGRHEVKMSQGMRVVELGGRNVVVCPACELPVGPSCLPFLVEPEPSIWERLFPWMYG